MLEVAYSFMTVAEVDVKRSQRFDEMIKKDTRHKTNEECRGRWAKAKKPTKEAIQYVASKSTGSAKQEINLVVIGPNYSCFDINQVITSNRVTHAWQP